MLLHSVVNEVLKIYNLHSVQLPKMLCLLCIKYRFNFLLINNGNSSISKHDNYSQHKNIKWFIENY